MTSPLTMISGALVGLAAAGAMVFGNEVIPPAEINIACDSFGMARDAAEVVIVLQCHANGNDFHIQIPGIDTEAMINLQTGEPVDGPEAE